MRTKDSVGNRTNGKKYVLVEFPYPSGEGLGKTVLTHILGEAKKKRNKRVIFHDVGEKGGDMNDKWSSDVIPLRTESILNKINEKMTIEWELVPDTIKEKRLLRIG